MTALSRGQPALDRTRSLAFLRMSAKAPANQRQIV